MFGIQGVELCRMQEEIPGDFFIVQTLEKVLHICSLGRVNSGCALCTCEVSVLQQSVCSGECTVHNLPYNTVCTVHNLPYNTVCTVHNLQFNTVCLVQWSRPPVPAFQPFSGRGARTQHKEEIYERTPGQEETCAPLVFLYTIEHKDKRQDVSNLVAVYTKKTQGQDTRAHRTQGCILPTQCDTEKTKPRCVRST